MLRGAMAGLRARHDSDIPVLDIDLHGFTREGTLRRAAWVNGEFVDEVILGLLATEWSHLETGS